MFLRVLKQPVRCMSKNQISSVKRDPGIRKRANLIFGNDIGADDIDLDNLETDFMDVHKTHREHLEEAQLMAEKVKYNIVKQKYFKEKYPNFLTWHDKEQMRYLHSTDPEEWTIEKLSEGFPALPHVISKIVRSNWRKRTQNKITNHDETVQNNWLLFKEGKMQDLPENLKKHLEKFTDRALNLHPFELGNTEPVSVVKNYSGEFSDIIATYEKIKNKNNRNETSTVCSENTISESLPIENVTFNKKQVTLEELKLKIESSIKKGIQISDVEKLVISREKRNSESKQIAPVDFAADKYKTGVLNSNSKSLKDVSHLVYPQRILIPKKILKRGYTYKLNDCYYDDDGEFLYRVPGME